MRGHIRPFFHYDRHLSFDFNLFHFRPSRKLAWMPKTPDLSDTRKISWFITEPDRKLFGYISRIYCQENPFFMCSPTPSDTVRNRKYSLGSSEMVFHFVRRPWIGLSVSSDGSGHGNRIRDIYSFMEIFYVFRVL